MGFVVFIAMGLYLMISIGVVFWAIVYSKKRGKNPLRLGLSAALVIYLIPFWDWIPTVVVHKYYCEREAGFWIYKTLDQWKAENPGVLDGLVSYNKTSGGFNVNWPSQQELRDGGHQKINTNHINARFDVVVSWQDISGMFPIVRKENVLLDVKNSGVIARYVDFSTGNSVKNTIGPPGPLKFWLSNGSCINGIEQQAKFGDFYLQFKGTEK